MSTGFESLSGCASEREKARGGDARRVLLLGSTGSIGRQTLDVIAGLNALHEAGRARQRFEVVGLAAGNNAGALTEQAAMFGVREIAIAGDSAELPTIPGVRVHRGADAAEALVRSVDADIVLAAMVGSAGLPATLAAIELGRDVALANKETLVAAGEIVIPAARRAGVRLMPVDSEHSAIWQCLPREVCPPCALGADVRRIVLTASGGPFRTKSREETYNATPEQALAHPTWNMGAKVTIDCASMTNKALEVVEAHWLFGVESARIEVVVHPQSIVHSLVEFVDASVIAQLGAPDMRTPIQYALTWPEHLEGRAPGIDLAQLSRLDFEPPDLERFPALRLAHEVIELGGVAGAVFNAANERAVEAFLDRLIPFGRITELTAAALEAIVGGIRGTPLGGLADVLAADREARRYVSGELGAGSVYAGPGAGR